MKQIIIMQPNLYEILTNLEILLFEKREEKRLLFEEPKNYSVVESKFSFMHSNLHETFSKLTDRQKMTRIRRAQKLRSESKFSL